MTTNIDINDIKEKLNAKLIDSGWARVLRGFLYSTEFDNILLKLWKVSFLLIFFHFDNIFF